MFKGVEGKYLLVKPLKDKFSARSFTIDKTLGNVVLTQTMYQCLNKKFTPVFGGQLGQFLPVLVTQGERKSGP